MVRRGWWEWDYLSSDKVQRLSKVFLGVFNQVVGHVEAILDGSRKRVLGGMAVGGRQGHAARGVSEALQ